MILVLHFEIQKFRAMMHTVTTLLDVYEISIVYISNVRISKNWSSFVTTLYFSSRVFFET